MRTKVASSVACHADVVMVHTPTTAAWQRSRRSRGWVSVPWTYRVTRDANGEYAIREVVTIDGKRGWTEPVSQARAESMSSLAWVLEKMTQALREPVLDISDEDNPYEVGGADAGSVGLAESGDDPQAG